MKSVGVPQKLEDEGFTEADVEKLVKLTYETPSLAGLLAIGPVGDGKEVVEAIYRNSLKPMA